MDKNNLNTFLKEILIEVLKSEKIDISFSNGALDLTKTAQDISVQALHEVKLIIENDSYDDFECVEKITCLLENYGSDGGGRHDFG